MEKLINGYEEMKRSRVFLNRCLDRYYKISKKNRNTDPYNRPSLILGNKGSFSFYDKFLKTYFKNKNVIDVGCANGFFSIWIAMYAKSVLGIDDKPANLKANNIMAKAYGLTNVSFRTMSAFDMSRNFLKDNKINGIFWHKTGFKEKNIDFYDNILCCDIIDIIICNFGPFVSDEFLKKELNYDIYWETKKAGGKGRLYALKSSRG